MVDSTFVVRDETEDSALRDGDALRAGGGFAVLRCTTTPNQWVMCGGGQLISVLVTDTAGAPAAADTVTINTYDPQGNLHTYTGSEISNPSIGVYQVLVPVTLSGQWTVTFESTGEGVNAVGEGSFIARQSRVFPCTGDT